MEGAITADHVGVLVSLDHGATEEPLHRQEQLLVDLARAYTFDQFKRLMAYWRQHVDPDGTTDGHRPGGSEEPAVAGGPSLTNRRSVIDQPRRPGTRTTPFT